MLVLELTDGHTCVRGLEVERIAGLHTQLPSGSKVLVNGTVVSRRGMILLTAPHIQLLGGEVDALGEENTPLANLERAMAKNREDGGHGKKEFSGKFLIRGDKKKSMQQNISSKWSRNGNSSSASTSQSFSKQNIKSDVKPNPQSLCGSNNQTGFGQSRNSLVIVKPEVKSQKSQKEEILKHEEIMSEDWEDDMDYAELFNDDDIDMMEDDELDLLLASSVHPSSDPPQTSDTQKQSSSKQESNQFSENSATMSKIFQAPQDNSEDLYDDDFELLEAELSMTNKKSKLEENDFSTASNSSLSTNRLPWFSKATKDSDNQQEQPVNSRPITPSVSSLSRTEKDSSITKSFSVKPGQFSTIKSPHESPKQSLFKLSLKKADTSPVIPVIPVISESNSHQTPQVCKSTSQYAGSTQSKLSCHKSRKSAKQCKLSDMFGAKTTSSDMQGNIGKMTKDNSPLPSQKSLVRPSSRSSPSTPLSFFSKRVIATPKAVVQPFQNDSSDFGEREKVPFSYLSELSTVSVGTSIIVKAYISTLTNKLNSCNGERWCLSCRINDGTDSVDVDLHNNVLTQLIGFSAPDSMVMKQRMRTEPDIKEILMEGLSGCQEKLSNTSCLMEIELPVPIGESATSGSVKPVLTKLIHLTEEHVMSLRDRVRN